MRLLLKSVFFLSFFLLGGYGYLHANSNHSDHCHSNRKIVAIAVSSTAAPARAAITGGLLNTNQTGNTFCGEETETEEVESSAGKRFIELSDYFTVFRPPMPGSPPQGGLTFTPVQASFPSSSRHILLHVIRI
ncbi:hypothetical protein DJ568_00060 [Mucilaginibacter hurinus]|uniref:Uncharacterized protein n=1 Tax=Mucilaginibacter hurinus TaxID=2201324 RepID=A0A367GT96_9SPHI|nr:hypothetical protein [Mucilaginibacter hurinus]RCH56295.1 hypothetical protein DJ568_00060 [Mucilaginibacter hurinus]